VEKRGRRAWRAKKLMIWVVIHATIGYIHVDNVLSIIFILLVNGAVFCLLV
jgi:hypothetical protein